MIANYRILTEDFKIKFTGTETGSWFNIEKARQLVDYSKGEMIYEYSYSRVRMYEVF